MAAYRTLRARAYPRSTCRICGPSTCSCRVLFGRTLDFSREGMTAWATYHHRLDVLAHAILRRGLLLRAREREYADYPWFGEDKRENPIQQILVVQYPSREAAPYYGCATLDPPRIVLNHWHDQDPLEQIVTLVHEVTHLLLGEVCPPGPDAHSAPWRNLYSEIVLAEFGMDVPYGVNPDHAFLATLQEDPDVLRRWKLRP